MDQLLKQAADLQDYVLRWLNVLRRTRSRLPLVFALTSAAAGALSQNQLPEALKSLVVVKYLPLVLYSVALGSLGVVAWKLRFRASPPEPIEPPKPSPIKGGLPFGPSAEDGKLFQQLGREAYLADLLQYVTDPLIPIVVVHGPIGVGKTSLVRSGLQYLLEHRDVPIPCAYWEAPTRTNRHQPSGAHAGAPANALLHALHVSFGKDYPTLSDFAKESEGPRRVIILDRLDQLDPGDASHDVIFSLLLSDASGAAPHRNVWILSFRDSFAQTWSDLESNHLGNAIVPHLALRLLTERQAREAATVIASKAKLGLDFRIINDLFKGETSPVQVAIALDGLADLARDRERANLNFDDYSVTGGAAHMIALYLEKHLAYLTDGKGEHQELLKALSALVNWTDDPPRPIFNGCALEYLAGRCKLPPGRLEFLLTRLAQARLVEDLGPEAFCLQSQQTIPVIKTLRLETLQVVRTLQQRSQESAAATYQPDLQDLFIASKTLENAPDLRLPPEEIQSLHLFVSKNLRGQLKRALIYLLLLAAPLLVFLYYRYSRNELYRGLLASWNLPLDLYVTQAQLDALALPRSVNRIDWISSNIRLVRLRRIPRRDVASDGRSWLARLPHQLTALDISNVGPADASSANWEALTSIWGLPAGIEYLNIDNNDRLADLVGLQQLNSLRSLSALDKGIANFDALPPSLTCLEVGSPYFDSVALDFLKRRLPKLRALRLEATGISQLDSLPETLESLGLFDNARLDDSNALDNLPQGLTSLAIDAAPRRPSFERLPAHLHELYLSRITVPTPAGRSWLPPDLRILGLQSVRVAPGGDWSFLFPASLRVLTLVGFASLPSALPAALESLVITLPAEGNLPVAPLPAQLTSLSLSNVRVDDLRELPSSLQRLDLILSRHLTHAYAFPPRLEWLDLSFATDLQELANLPVSLRHLSVAGCARLRQLPPLPEHLEELDVSGTGITSLAGLPPNLKVLTLGVGQVTTLRGLPPKVHDLRFVDEPGSVTETARFGCQFWTSPPGRWP